MGLIEGAIMGAVASAIKTARWNKIKKNASASMDSKLLIIDGRLCDWDTYFETAVNERFTNGVSVDSLLKEMDSHKKNAERLWREDGKEGEHYQSEVVAYYIAKLCLKISESGKSLAAFWKGYKEERCADEIVFENYEEFEAYFSEEIKLLEEELVAIKVRNGYDVVLKWRSLFEERTSVQDELNSMGIFGDRGKKKALIKRCEELDEEIQRIGAKAKSVERAVKEETELVEKRRELALLAHKRYEKHKEYRDIIREIDELTEKLNQVEEYIQREKLIEEQRKKDGELFKVSPLKLSLRKELKKELEKVGEEIRRSEEVIKQKAGAIWADLDLAIKRKDEIEYVLDKELKRINAACKKAIEKMLEEPPYSAWMCDACGEINPLNKDACDACGKKRGEKTAEIVEVRVVTESVPEVVAGQTVEGRGTEAANGFFCRKCGKRLPSDSVYCSYCGEKVVL